MKDSTKAATTLGGHPAEERVMRQAQAYLHTSPYSPLRALSCELDNGVITVKGRVPTFYLKQLAFAELMQKLCVCEINDLIEVTLPNEAARLKDGTSQAVPRLRRSGRRGK